MRTEIHKKLKISDVKDKSHVYVFCMISNNRKLFEKQNSLKKTVLRCFEYCIIQFIMVHFSLGEMEKESIVYLLANGNIM